MVPSLPAVPWSWCLLLLSLLVSGLGLADAARADTAVVPPRGPAAAALSPWWRVADPAFQRLTRAQGLPNDVTYSLAQDPQGFMWIGTVSGLARWDGYRAEVFRPDPDRLGSLPDGWIQDLLVDPQGRLWVATGAGGVARWDAAAGRFERVAVTTRQQGAGLSHANVHALLPDGDQGLWAATDAGLDRIDTRTLQVQRQADAGERLQGLPRDRMLALLRGRDGVLWVGTGRGLFRLKGPVAQAVPLAGAPGVPVVALHEDGEGRVWVGTTARGAFVVMPGAAQGQPLHLPGGTDLADLHVPALAEVQPGRVWLATLGQGVLTLDLAPGPALQVRQVRQLRNRPAWPFSLGDDTVRGLLRDRSGLLWLATDGGVSVYDSTQTAVHTVLGLPGVPGLDKAEISAVLQAGDGRVWLGTHRHGVAIVEPAGRTQRLVPDRHQTERALPQDIVLALAEGDGGQVFVATKRGLYRAQADGRGLQRLAWPGRDPAAPVWALLRQGGTLWVGGATDGLWALDLASGRARAVAHHDQPEPQWQLTDDRVTVLAAAADGGLWVGTRQGLDRLDPQRGVLARWRLSPGDPASLPGGFITGVHTDRQGRLWVAAYGGGLAMLPAPQRPGTAFTRISAAQGLPDDSVNTLLEDELGRIWTSTDSGLAMVDPVSLRVRPLHPSDGAVLPVYWTGAAARLAGGELAFGGAGGLTLAQPRSMADWRHVPPVVLTALQVGGQAVPLAAQGRTPLQLPPQANSLHVEFAALDYSDTRRLRYAVRLDGVDTDWVPRDADRRSATYERLAPGHYTLHIRGSNRHGSWAEPPLQLAFEVLPAWHQTWAFRTGTAVLAVLALALGLRWRDRSARQRQLELAQAVDERTAQLRALSQQLAEQGQALALASVTDPLTGLHNRRHLVQRMQDPRADQPLALLLIDVDHFKQVNDERGHAVGDAALVALALRLRSLLQPGDDLVRWGGEEFLLVARGLGVDGARQLARTVRDRVAAEALALRGHGHLQASVSVGFACLPFVAAAPQALDWEAVLSLADQALYAAKRLGRNRWVGLAAGAALPAAQAEGLALRAHADPDGCLARGELIALAEPADQAAVAGALRG